MQALRRFVMPARHFALGLGLGVAGASVTWLGLEYRRSQIDSRVHAAQDKERRLFRETMARMKQASVTREQLDDLAPDGYNINILSIWAMYTTLPGTADKIKRRLIDKDPSLRIRDDYAVSLATLSRDNFYELVPVLFQRNVDQKNASHNATLFRELFILMRDIHDEHDDDYVQPHKTYTHWPGKFDETRAAITWLIGRPEVPKHAKAESFVVREYLRISNPANDLVREPIDA